MKRPDPYVTTGGLRKRRRSNLVEVDDGSWTAVQHMLAGAAVALMGFAVGVWTAMTILR